MSLMSHLLSLGSIPSTTLDESDLFNKKDDITTDVPIINVAFSGRLNGGLTSGLTVLAGESKSFKTLLSLHCMKAYFNKYPDSAALFYDSEFGSTPAYLAQFGLPLDRIIHIPIQSIEQLKFDIRKRLEGIERGQKVFVMVDSLGNLASKKEDEDALEGKSVADMSRAKAIKSLFRIITPHLTIKDIPCIVINHIYKEMGMYPKSIVSGGTGVMYSANQVFIITRAQEKEGEELVGYRFTLNVEKSRFVKEKSRMTFIAKHDSGIQKYSGLWDLAEEAGLIQNQSKGWYSINGGKSKCRATEIEEDTEFWENLINNEEFKQYVENKFILKNLEIEDEK